MKILKAEFVTSAALRLAPGQSEGLAQGKPPQLAPGQSEGLAQGKPLPLAPGQSEGLAQGKPLPLAPGQSEGLAQGIPRDGVAQVAMAGRSNVGKSTLINALVRTAIARTSAAPGKTRLANVYRALVDGGPGGPGRWSVYFVDLPGYGYARGGDTAAQELARVAEAYFMGASERLRPERTAGLPAGAQPWQHPGAKVGGKRREAPSATLRQAQGRPERSRATSESAWGCPPAPRLRRGLAEARTDSSRARAEGPTRSDRRCTLLLVDSRHPGLVADVQAHRWLSTVGPPPLVVATKVDKLSRAERVRNLRELEHVFGTPALPVSATGGEGLDELWKAIANLARDVGRHGTATER